MYETGRFTHSIVRTTATSTSSESFYSIVDSSGREHARFARSVDAERFLEFMREDQRNLSRKWAEITEGSHVWRDYVPVDPEEFVRGLRTLQVLFTPKETESEAVQQGSQIAVTVMGLVADLIARLWEHNKAYLCAFCGKSFANTWEMTRLLDGVQVVSPEETDERAVLALSEMLESSGRIRRFHDLNNLDLTFLLMEKVWQRLPLMSEASDVVDAAMERLASETATHDLLTVCRSYEDFWNRVYPDGPNSLDALLGSEIRSLWKQTRAVIEKATRMSGKKFYHKDV